MASQGISVDKEALSRLFAALADTSVVDAIAAGSKKTASMPSGGARAAGPTAGAGGGAPAEEKKEEEEEKEDVDMGGLFGGDGDDYY